MDSLFTEASEMSAVYAAQRQRQEKEQTKFNRYWQEKQTIEAGRTRMNSEEWYAYEDANFERVVPDSLPEDPIAQKQVLYRTNRTQFQQCEEFEFFTKAVREGKTFYKDAYSNDPGVYVPRVHV